MTHTESEIQAAIVDYLTATGWYARIFSQDKSFRRQLAGWVDVWAVRRGVSLVVQVKAPGGRLSEAQCEFARAIAPHIATTCRYVEADCLEDVVEMVGDRVS